MKYLTYSGSKQHQIGLENIIIRLTLSSPGSAYEETELLTWLLYQMKEDTIENVNRDILNQMMATTEYLAVFFCK